MLDDRFLLALQSSVTDDAAFDVVLALLADAFRCRSAALVYVDAKAPAATIAVAFGVLDAEAQRRYVEDYAKDDPAPAAMAKLKVGQVVTTGRLFDAEAPEYDRFIREFYHPLGLREAMGGPVATINGQNGVLAVQRGDDRGAFGDADMQALAKVMPHVAAAITQRRKFFDLEATVGTLRSAFDDVGVATMIFDGSGTLRHANLLARGLLDRRDGLVLNRTGRLGAVDLGTDRRLARFFGECPDLASPLVRVPRIGTLVPYVVKATQSDPLLLAGGIVIKICDPSNSHNDVTPLLAFALQMSTPCAELTAALVNGEDLKGFAKRTGTSPNTMRFRLKGAFAASATRRQADLVRVATSIIRDLG